MAVTSPTERVAHLRQAMTMVPSLQKSKSSSARKPEDCKPANEIEQAVGGGGLVPPTSPGPSVQGMSTGEEWVSLLEVVQKRPHSPCVRRDNGSNVTDHSKMGKKPREPDSKGL